MTDKEKLRITGNSELASVGGYNAHVHIYRESRKLIDILNTWGNVLVPSINADKTDATAKERLQWLVDVAKSKYGLTIEDIEQGIKAL